MVLDKATRSCHSHMIEHMYGTRYDGRGGKVRVKRAEDGTARCPVCECPQFIPGAQQVLRKPNGDALLAPADRVVCIGCGRLLRLGRSMTRRTP